MNWLVKSRHSGRVYYGFRFLEEAQEKSAAMNAQYQTDEYKVEAFDLSKAFA